MCLKRCCAASFLCAESFEICTRSMLRLMLGWLAGARHGFTFPLENTATRWHRIFQAVFGNAISVPIPDGTTRKFGKRCSTPVPVFRCQRRGSGKAGLSLRQDSGQARRRFFFRKASPSSPAWLRRRAGTASCPPNCQARRPAASVYKNRREIEYMVHILCIGDVVGSAGCEFLRPIFPLSENKGHRSRHCERREFSGWERHYAGFRPIPV